MLATTKKTRSTDCRPKHGRRLKHRHGTTMTVSRWFSSKRRDFAMISDRRNARTVPNLVQASHRGDRVRRRTCFRFESTEGRTENKVLSTNQAVTNNQPGTPLDAGTNRVSDLKQSPAPRALHPCVSISQADEHLR